MKTNRLTQILAIGIAIMGIVHIAATFSPVILGKLSPLASSMQQACIYFSLMCGLLLIVGGVVTSLLSEQVTRHNFLRAPYWVLLSAMAIDGVLSVCFMPHNPCAWVILALTIGALATYLYAILRC